jgi:hypothetical protein
LWILVWWTFHFISFRIFILYKTVLFWNLTKIILYIVIHSVKKTVKAIRFVTNFRLFFTVTVKLCLFCILVCTTNVAHVNLKNRDNINDIFSLISYWTLYNEEAGVAQSVWWLGYRLDDWGSIPDRGREIIFPFSTTSRLALGPTPSPLLWVPGTLSLG